MRKTLTLLSIVLLVTGIVLSGCSTGSSHGNSSTSENSISETVFTEDDIKKALDGSWGCFHNGEDHDERYMWHFRFDDGKFYRTFYRDVEGESSGLIANAIHNDKVWYTTEDGTYSIDSVNKQIILSYESESQYKGEIPYEIKDGKIVFDTKYVCNVFKDSKFEEFVLQLFLGEMSVKELIEQNPTFVR